ncbi:hypothetical protein E2C01_090305 [Portunus trituberculatus]|uniref:Uncharacterized protein n=1 Tax=Portunus trituberculatus TaxID=210409 RepID=A0A5B7JJX0_PORTR|nr:hypothetical protein [Portunus trituberculatus]
MDLRKTLEPVRVDDKEMHLTWGVTVQVS